ncbi:MAG: ribonuclease [Thermoleophilia bacterium]|jgi:membrane protein|nr:ribonuclease [Thermoleophilia bacterium]
MGQLESCNVTTSPKQPLARRAWDRFVYLVVRQAIMTEHPAWERFFARRMPHLAGMIAYFGVLSIIPAAFLFISALALTGQLESQGWIVEQLKTAIPGDGADTIVRTVENLRDNSGSLGVIGFIGLVWGTSNFFSCLETGLNIIYGVNNRHFVFQKLWVLVLMLAALVALTVVTVLVAVVKPFLDKLDEVAERTLHLPFEDSLVTLGIGAVIAFCFFASCYRFLPNTTMSSREVWRGALIASIAFEVSIQLLPTLVAENRGGAILSAFAGAFIVLIWFYLMAFVLLVGGVYNWWWREKRRRAAAEEMLGGA